MAYDIPDIPLQINKHNSEEATSLMVFHSVTLKDAYRYKTY